MAIFLDASYLLALYNEDDVHHARARIIAKSIVSNEYGQAITSDDVFDEVVSVALRKFGKQHAILFSKQILKSALIIHGNKNIFSTAHSLFVAATAQFSFTDCTSQAIMNLANVKYIATFDKEFEKLTCQVVN